jgi:hypothetical protein
LLNGRGEVQTDGRKRISPIGIAGGDGLQKICAGRENFRQVRGTQKTFFTPECQVARQSLYSLFARLVGLGLGNDLARIELIDFVDQLVGD